MRQKPQSYIDRGTYVPAGVERAMSQQMERMPANLKHAIESERATGYISRGTEREMSAALQRNLPDHLKKYAGAYLEQHVQPTGRFSGASLPNHPVNPPPMPSPLRRDHSMPQLEQHTVHPDSLPAATELSMFANDESSQPRQFSPADLPSSSQAPTEPPNPNSNYDFIMQPTEATPSKLGLPSLPGLGSGLSKLLIGLGVLLVVIIVISVLKSALSGTSNVPALVSVLQDQQELIHITSNTTTSQASQGLSATSQNLIATLSLGMSSSSQQLITYLHKNGHSVSQKQLGLKISTVTDQNLTSAQAAGTYDSTLTQVINQELNTYTNDLSTAFNLTKGPKGQALLRSDYAQAKLLLSQQNVS